MLEAAIPRIPSACLPTAHRSASLSLRLRSGCERSRAARRSWRAATSSTPSSISGCSSRYRHPLRLCTLRTLGTLRTLHPCTSAPLHLCTLHHCAPAPLRLSTSAPLHPSIPANLSTRLAPRHRRRSQCAAKTPSPSAKPSSASSGGPSTSTSSIRHACNHSTRACKHSTQNCNRSAHACNHSNTSPPARDRSNTHQQPRPRRTSSSCRSPRACTGPSR